MDIEQSFGIAGRYQRAMEFPVVPLPQLCDRPVAFCHLPFEDGQLVISRDNVALPFQVTRSKRACQGVTFEEEPHRRDLAEAIR